MNPADLKRFSFERDGVLLAAYDSGGDGPTVVFQHGLCGDIGQVAEAFPEGTGFRLIGLECRGHGASEAGADFSVAAFAGDVAALMEQVDRPVVLAGISMGAAIASRIAVRRPELVAALVMARPAWVTEAAPDNLQPNAEVGELLSRLPPAQARTTFTSGETYRRLMREAPDNAASLLGFFTRDPVSVTASLLSTISADGPGVSETEFAAVKIPTLILATGQDFIHPLAHAERLARLIPGARLAEITPKGVSRPRYLSDFHAALGAFLKGL